MNNRQEIFLTEYLVDMNGAAAARRAGYSSKNASAAASRILALPEAQGRIRRELEKRRAESEVSAGRVRSELGKLAFSQAEGAAVGHKVRCLEILAKLLGMFETTGGVEEVTVVEDV